MPNFIGPLAGCYTNTFLENLIWMMMMRYMHPIVVAVHAEKEGL